MATEVELKRWGNSMGVVLPKDFINEMGLKEKDKILIDVVKKANLTKVFGSLKTKRRGQAFKDFVREGWEK